MSSTKAIAALTVWLLAAFFIVAATTIYGFNYFEPVLGDRLDNLLFSMIFYGVAILAVVIAFAATLLFRAGGRSVRPLYIFIAAILICALAHLLAIAGPLLERFDSWELRAAGSLGYCAMLGALAAEILLRFATPFQPASHPS